MKKPKDWTRAINTCVIIFASLFVLRAIASDLETSPVEANPAPEPGWQVAEMLLNTPSWYVEDDSDAKAFILRRCYALGRFRVDDLREGVALFVKWVKQMPYLQQVEERAKVALLGRVLFEVPEFIAREESISGMYTCSVVEESGGVVRLWIAPLRMTVDKTLQIAGNQDLFLRKPTFGRVDEEFEYFAKRYPRRNLVLSTDGRLIEKTQ